MLERKACGADGGCGGARDLRPRTRLSAADQQIDSADKK
jgi:hypothetical protein